MPSREEYFKILGLPEGADKQEIKKAYRSLAKRYHPDVSKNADSHERFITITEAYEYLSSGPARNQAKGRETEAERRRKARAKAAAYARMKYADFMESDYYKSTSAISTLVDAVIFISLTAILVFCNLVVSKEYGRSGIAGLFIFDLVILSLIILIAAKTKAFNLRKYFKALYYLMRWEPFNIVMMTILNLILFMRIALQTFIPFNMLLGIYFLIAFLSFMVMIFFIKGKPYFMSLCVFPLAFNLLLLINYSFSRNDSMEQYGFQKEVQRSGAGYQESTFIHLDHGIYEEYPGIRIFFDYSSMKFAEKITYTIADGCLGIRVMKSYRFD